MRQELKLRVFENRVVRNISGPRENEVTGDWRRLHNEGLHAFCSSPNIIWVIKSRTMWWAGHVARIGDRRNAVFLR